MKPEITSAVEQLRLFFPRGSTVYCVLRHCSKSGMRREIGFIGIGEYVFHPNYLIATALDMTANKDGDGIKVRGCGMDMGFHVVGNLATLLYGDYKVLSTQWL